MKSKSFERNFGFILRDLRILLRNRRVLRFGLRWLFKKAIAEWHFEHEKKGEVEFISSLLGAEKEDILRYYQESRGLPSALLYVTTRIVKPEVIVETGVEYGRSTWSILQALETNGKGNLWSIELGGGRKIPQRARPSLPDEEVGKLVPQNLKKRWHLILGDAKNELPPLLQRLKEIDIFLHDSLHTEEHMMFEYQTAWSFLKEGGLLLSDDISFSFREFASKVGRPYYLTGNIPRFGGIRKE
jgi:hypothetical protein